MHYNSITIDGLQHIYFEHNRNLWSASLRLVEHDGVQWQLDGPGGRQQADPLYHSMGKDERPLESRTSALLDRELTAKPHPRDSYR